MSRKLHSRLFKWPLLSALVLGSLASAFDYRVDPEGGPQNLRERVARAYARWQGVDGTEVEARETEDAPNVIRYGDGTLFGPDTFSLTVQRTPDPTTVVLLNPAEPSDRALTHELGLLAGLSPDPGARSVMNPAISQEADAELTPADEAALRALAAFVPADINQDGVVDFYDLADFSAAFGETGVSLPADIDDSSVVNRADLDLLRDAYTFGAPAETAPEEAAAAATPGVGGMSGGAQSGGGGSTLSGGAMSGGTMSGGTMTGGTMSGGGQPGGTLSGGAQPGGTVSGGGMSGGGL